MTNTRSPILVALMLGLTLSSSAALAQDSNTDKSLATAKKLQSAVVDVVKKISPAFVVIGGGSGVVISEDGWILTNHHVAGSRPIGSFWRIKMPGGKIFKAKMVGTDPTGDISLLKIESKKVKSFPYVTFADSDKCRVGQWVIALGNPFGFAKDSTPTVTLGLISAFNRYRGNYGDAIQTDAAINSGNSGGPLLDVKGRLVGINGQITTRHGVKINSGAGYAISINQIKRFMPALKKGGTVSHGSINGIGVQDTRAGGTGALISRVRSDTAADKAGFKQGDVIVEIAGMPVNNASRARGIISTFPAGAELTVKVKRGDKIESVKVELEAVASRRGFNFRRRNRGQDNQNPRPYMGARLADGEGGIVVRSVTQGSPADKAGLKEGDKLISVDGQTVQKRTELRSLMSKAKVGQTLRLIVEREGQKEELSLTLGQRTRRNRNP